MGLVTEIGAGVALLKVGDRVVMPFNVSKVLVRSVRERGVGC